MNVLLITPTTLAGGANENKSSTRTTPNLGLLYISSYLKSKTDAEVRFIDIVPYRISEQQFASLIRDFQPRLVGITAKTFDILGCYKISETIKLLNPEIKIIVGGAHPTALPEYTLKECPSIDAAVMGEGEITTLEIYERMKDGCSDNDRLFSDLPGATWRSETGDIHKNSERSVISDLDSLPFPDLPIVDFSKYEKLYDPTRRKLLRVFPVFASRGCPFNCTFCMPLLTRKHRVRSIESVLEEVELLHRNYGAQLVYFEDSLFCSRKEWFEGFCSEYMKRGLHKKVAWGFETRIDSLSSDLFITAKQAGCIYTFFGVESGNEEVLRKANKKYSREEIIEKTTSAHKAGIKDIRLSLIIGLPYETSETVKDTLSLIDILPFAFGNINILDIYPGTRVFEMVDKGEGGIRWIEGCRMNWSAYSRSLPMAEVNDLTAQNLIDLQKKGLDMLAKRGNSSDYYDFRKKMAIFFEFAKNDRARIARYIRRKISGKR